VTGNANPAAGGAYDTANQGNGGAPAPASLGLGTLNLNTTTDGNSTAIIKPTVVPSLNAAITGASASTGGSIAAGTIAGTGFGYLATQPDGTGSYGSYANLTWDSPGNQPTFNFQRMTFQAVAGGTTHITVAPANSTALQVFTNTKIGDDSVNAGTGAFSNPDTYGARNLTGADTVTGFNAITINVAGSGGTYAYDNGTVASTLGGSSAGNLNIKSPAPGGYLDNPVLSGIASTKGFVTLTTTDTGANTNKLGLSGEVPVYVLVDFNLGSTTLTTLEGELAAAAGSDTIAVSDNQGGANAVMNTLQGEYGTTLFPSNGTLLFTINTSHTGPTPIFGWDLSSLTGISVNNIIAVPEPASLGLLASVLWVSSA
jgi:hypothetical protein